MNQAPAWDLAARGRTSLRARVARLRAKSWHIGQAAIAAGVAWYVAAELLGHQNPFFAPIAAVVSLGTSYGQRLRRVAEVTVGVAIGVFIADLVIIVIGPGAWQLTVVVALAMSAALLLDAGAILVMQAAVQSIVVASLVTDTSQALTRWTDALVGGAVALAAATVVPRAPLRRPGEQAARVLDRIAALLRGAGKGITDGDVEEMLDLLSDARTTDILIEELVDASREGLSVVASSPFRVRHRAVVRQMSELVEPLDLALRNTRVLIRRVSLAAYRRDQVPRAYALLCVDLAVAVDHLAEEVRGDRRPELVQAELVRLAESTSNVDRTDELSAEVILAQLRSIIADLLRITGMNSLEATDAIPPLRHG